MTLHWTIAEITFPPFGMKLEINDPRPNKSPCLLSLISNSVGGALFQSLS